MGSIRVQPTPCYIVANLYVWAGKNSTQCPSARTSEERVIPDMESTVLAVQGSVTLRWKPSTGIYLAIGFLYPGL